MQPAKPRLRRSGYESVALGALLLWVGVTLAPHLVSLAYHNLGEISRVKGERGTSPTRAMRAPQAYERAIALNPNNFLPYLGYGHWALSQDDPLRAAALLERAVALHPTYRPARFYLGVAYLEQDRMEQAMAQFRQSDVLPSYLVHRGWQHVERIRAQASEDPDWMPAERYYRGAVALAPEDLRYWQYLAEFYTFWPRDYAQVLATWRAAARALPDAPLPHRRAAQVLWERWRDAPGALAELEEAVRLAPDDVESYLQAAEILRQAGDLTAAEAWLRRATEAVPENGEAYFQLGELYLAQGRAPQAIRALRAATAAAPTEARYPARLAEALQRMGLLTEAVRAAEAAATLAPEEAAYHRLLGGLYQEMGERERALAAYRRVLELAPDDPQARGAVRALTGTTEVVHFTTRDGVTLEGTLYGGGSAAVVFSHMAGGNRKRWDAVAREVAAQGYLVLTYDFRAHGASQGDYDPAHSPDDLRAALAFVRRQGATRVALVGASLGGMTSLKVAAGEKVAAVIAISTPMRFANLVVQEAELAAIRAPTLLITTAGDWAASQTLRAYELIQAPREKQVFAGDAHGTDILGTQFGPELRQRIVAFLQANLPLQRVASQAAVSSGAADRDH